MKKGGKGSKSEYTFFNGELSQLHRVSLGLVHEVHHNYFIKCRLYSLTRMYM